MDISLYFVTMKRAGESGFYSRGTRPGEVRLDHDSKKYWYAVPAGRLSEFLSSAGAAFAGRGMPPCSIIGKYPHYEVQTEY